MRIVAVVAVFWVGSYRRPTWESKQSSAQTTSRDENVANENFDLNWGAQMKVALAAAKTKFNECLPPSATVRDQQKHIKAANSFNLNLIFSSTAKVRWTVWTYASAREQIKHRTNSQNSKYKQKIRRQILMRPQKSAAKKKLNQRKRSRQKYDDNLTLNNIKREAGKKKVLILVAKSTNRRVRACFGNQLTHEVPKIADAT